MLKTIRSLNKPAPSKNDGSKSASSRNNNSRPASKKNNGNNEIDRFGVDRNSMEHAKKSGKLFKSENLSKSRKSKSKKISKSRNLAKSGKKLSKNENSTNFNVIEAGPKFLTLDARTAFNHLQLAFIETLILQYFDLKCHI